ncbi:MAG: putative rhamnosyl transferase [Candidatus Margulisbacteria bacterium]|jgi:hypothetical protein|nr:putative rhamnosyl transferase [Candidatus Margulisiibacteriota bacterium]
MSEIKRQPIIGLVQYSEHIPLGRGGAPVDVFAPEYFEYRFKIFQEITLKSLQTQTDKNFNLLLLHADDMPDKYKERFKVLEQENTFLRNIYLAQPSEWGTYDFVREHVCFRDGLSISFRIDNDDAVPRDFIARLNAYLSPAFKGFVISIPRIIYISRLASRLFLKTQYQYWLHPVGLAYVTGKENYQTILMQGDHTLVYRAHPVIMLPGPGGIQSVNGFNVVNRIDYLNADFLWLESLKKLLKEHNFADLDFTCLKSPKWNHSNSYISEYLRERDLLSRQPKR